MGQQNFKEIKKIKKSESKVVTLAGRLLSGAAVGSEERPRPSWWELKVGGGWIRGDVWPKALSPRC